MGLLQASKVYKPFEFGWAFEFWKRQQQTHWLPEEVPLGEDCRDWAQKLTDHERNLLTQIFRFFTQADVEVQDCFIKGTDVLTPRGFVPFHELTDDDFVAQVHPENMCVEFVKPLRIVHRQHTGKMVRFLNDGGHVSALVTPNHEMFYERIGTLDSGKRYKETAAEIGMTQYRAFHTAALAPTAIQPSFYRGSVLFNDVLTDYERLLIAYQADGQKNVNSKQMIFGFKKIRKIERMRALLERLNCQYRESLHNHPEWGEYTYFTIDNIGSKPVGFEWVDLSNVSRRWCEEFLEEVSHWDAWRSETGHVQYRSTNRDAAAMVEAVRVLAGYKGKSVNCTYSNQSPHTLVTYTSRYSPARLAKVNKEFVDVVDADVYCVTVPTGVIITRYQGSTLVVGNCYHEKYGRVFKPTEIKMMLTAFSNMETVHIAAYSHLLDTIGMPESEYSAFLQYKEMKDKVDYLDTFGIDSDEDIARTLAMFGAFTEGLQLFASFAMLMNFQRFNKMKGMCTIVSWSVRDESLHCEGIIRLFHAFCQERQCLTPRVKQDITDMCRKTVTIEDAFIDLVFEMGPVEGMKPEDIKQYIRYIADWRLGQLGLDPIYGVTEHPIPWLVPLLNGVEHANFFEQRATEYSKAASKGQWNAVWNDFDMREETLRLVSNA